jgi:hypothetical protein
MAVDIGFLNPDTENRTTVPAARSVFWNPSETVKVSVEEENVQEIVLSKFCRADHKFEPWIIGRISAVAAFGFHFGITTLIFPPFAT